MLVWAGHSLRRYEPPPSRREANCFFHGVAVIVPLPEGDVGVADRGSL